MKNERDKLPSNFLDGPPDDSPEARSKFEAKAKRIDALTTGELRSVVGYFTGGEIDEKARHLIDALSLDEIKALNEFAAHLFPPDGTQMMIRSAFRFVFERRIEEIKANINNDEALVATLMDIVNEVAHARIEANGRIGAEKRKESYEPLRQFVEEKYLSLDKEGKNLPKDKAVEAIMTCPRFERLNATLGVGHDTVKSWLPKNGRRGRPKLK